MTNCNARVHDPSGWGRYYSCSRKGNYFEEGKHWCKTHAPSTVKAKNEANHAKWDREAVIRANDHHTNAQGRAAIELVRRIAEDGLLTVNVRTTCQDFIETYEKGLRNV